MSSIQGKFEVEIPSGLRDKISPMPWDVRSGMVLDANGKVICNILDNWINPYDHAFVVGWNANHDEEKIEEPTDD